MRLRTATAALVAAVALAACASPDVAARRAAYAALPSLLDPPPAVLRGLLEALEAEPDPASRRIATVALSQLAPTADEALRHAVVAALSRVHETADDPDLRRSAERALARLGSGALA